MLYFFYGPDGYRIKKAREALADDIAKKHGAPVSRFDLEEDNDRQRFAMAVKSRGLFAEKQTLIALHCFAWQEFAKLLADYNAETDPDRFIMAIQEGSEAELKKKNKELFAYLLRKGDAENIEPLEDAKLAAWTVREASLRGITLSLAIARELAFRVTDPDKYRGNNTDRSWRIAQELDKLASYSAGRSAIVNEDLNAVVPEQNREIIFALTDALAEQSVPRSLSLLYRQLENGADPNYIFSMFIYQFRNLMTVKSALEEYGPRADIASKTKLHPFVARKTASQAQKYTMDELKQKFIDLHDLEMAFKGGAMDLADGLYSFVLSLA